MSYTFVNTFVDGLTPATGRWSEGNSLDGKSQFSTIPGQPMGEEPVLSAPRPDSGAQNEQMMRSVI
jgi:Mn-containing catalase